MRVMSAPIAQMDRASDYESAGRVFESPWARQQDLEVSRLGYPLFLFGIHIGVEPSITFRIGAYLLNSVKMSSPQIIALNGTS